MGKLILFEGVDGTGKSSVIAALSNSLINDGYSVVMYREPGSTELGEELRTLITSASKPSNQLTKLFMFYAARHNLMPELAKSLEKYDYVLLDRYTPSTLAYQSVAITGSDMTNWEDMDLIRRLYNVETINLNYIIPDLTICFYADGETCVERIKKRENYREIDNEEILKHLNRVQNQYHYVMSFLRTQNWRVNELSTSDLTTKEVADECLSWLKAK